MECLIYLSLGGFSVFAGVGERTREGNDLYREMIESGVIKLGDKLVNLMQHLLNPLFLDVYYPQSVVLFLITFS